MTTTSPTRIETGASRKPASATSSARRFLLRLSLANWGIAVVAWTISAFLGITSPASIIVYSVLFVIGLFAVIVALLTYVLEKFAHEPPAVAPGEPGGDEDDAEAVSAGDAPAASRELTGLAGVPGSGSASKPALFARLVKIEHSVYALPFAYAGAFLAADGAPTWAQLLWITVAMVGARSAAMALNRLIDAELDARNPRTAARELPAGPPRAARGLALHGRVRGAARAGRLPALRAVPLPLADPARRLRPLSRTPSASRGSATTRSASRWAWRRRPRGWR